MANYFGFSSDKIDIFFMLIDSSSSMEYDEENVRSGLKMYKKSFENFDEAGSIAVNVSKFNSDFYPGEFQPITEFSTDYRTDGSTALYYSIVEGAELLQSYIQEVTEKKGVVPRATFILFSDGEPCCDPGTFNEARSTITNLNYAGVNTVFIAFKEAINSDFGKRLGFMATIDVTDRNALVNFLGVELSKSCKEQSKSLKSLGANFFSKAAGETVSEGYSQATAQALEDDSWIEDI